MQCFITCKLFFVCCCDADCVVLIMTLYHLRDFDCDVTLTIDCFTCPIKPCSGLREGGGGIPTPLEIQTLKFTQLNYRKYTSDPLPLLAIQFSGFANENNEPIFFFNVHALTCDKHSKCIYV